MFHTIFNGVLDRDVGIMTVSRPARPIPKENIKEYDLPGRDGKLTEHLGTYQDIQISVDFNFVQEIKKWESRVREISRWLSGTGELSFSDDPDIYYKVKSIEAADITRSKRVIGKFTVKFTVDPYQYSRIGENEIPLLNNLENPGEESSPIYRIEGEGNFTLTVNANSMAIDVGQNITIDTEKEMAYKDDGSILNTTVIGEFEDLRLKKGSNTLSATAGFTVTVKPNWRYL